MNVEEDTPEDDALALAAQRDAEMESGEVTGVSHAELMERLRGDADQAR